MKNKSRFALMAVIAASIAAPNISHADYLIFSSTDTWSINRSTALTGSQTSDELTATGHDTTLTLGKYSGDLDLTRVVITILKPLPPTSPDYEMTLSNVGGIGTNNFISAEAYAQTTISLTNIWTAIVLGSGGTVLPASQTAVFSGSNSATNFSLVDAETRSLDFSVSGSQAWFDSSTTSLSAAQLASIFGGGGSFSINDVAALVGFNYDRSNASPPDARLNAAGIDSGLIRIDYYSAVPEPSTVALLGLGSLGAIIWLRKRRSRV